MTKKTPPISRLSTGILDLDALLSGGLPRGSGIVIAGPPGSGKTILTHQICFHNATPDARVLYFNTLSEPTAKTLRFMSQFSFFDPEKIGRSVEFRDVGGILRADGLESASELIMEHVKRVQPAIVVIDSFKVFDDLARSSEELRKFSYQIAVNLLAWETTAFLLGEYASPEYESNPLFSIADGLVALSQREEGGEQQRFLKVVKMRGSAHSSDQHAFVITDDGIAMFAAGATREHAPERAPGTPERCLTHIPKLDLLLGPGIPWGSSILLSGVAGTGKTVLALEFLYRGALAGEKGILFSFEETEERLRSTARSLGWDLDAEIARGMIEIVFIPQPEITVERHLFLMRAKIEALGAKRVVVDSLSVFLHKIEDAHVSRDKIFHLGSIIHNAQAVALLATDIPYGSKQLSRFGVEETVVDGVVLLTASEQGLERERYIEIYKLRNTAHLGGRHHLVIGPGGVSIFPRYGASPDLAVPAPAVDITHRLASGVPGLDALLGGGLLERSATIVSGSAGIGKTTLAIQFILEGAREGTRGLFVSLEEGPEQLVASADALGLPLRSAIDSGLVEILYLARAHLRVGQFLTILADKLTGSDARRIVIDAATHLLDESAPGDEIRNLLYDLVVRFKSLGVTTLLTLEASSLFSAEHVTMRSLSPVADNLIVMRYRDKPGRFDPTLTVVKTRGTAHDRGTYGIAIGEGGIRIAVGDASEGRS